MSKTKGVDEYDILKGDMNFANGTGSSTSGSTDAKLGGNASTSLLGSLNDDVNDYHKKVQMKNGRRGGRAVTKEKVFLTDKDNRGREDNDEEDDAEDDDNADVIRATAAAAVKDQADNMLDNGNTHGDEDDDDEEEHEDDDDDDDEDEEDHQIDDDQDAAAFSGAPIQVNLKRKLKNRDGDSNLAVKRPKLSKKRRIYSWTKEEDEMIVYFKEDQKYSWKKIEEQLDFRHTWQAIQMRYLRNHKSRNEEWSRFMEVKMINAIRKDWENRWKRIGIELGRDFSPERCVQKNMELCKRMEMEYVKSIFQNKEITSGYSNPFNDISNAEAHKKLMLVYMGLDSISYDESDDEGNGATKEADDEEVEDDVKQSDNEVNEQDQVEDEEKEDDDNVDNEIKAVDENNKQ